MSRIALVFLLMVLPAIIPAQDPNAFHLTGFVSLDTNAVVWPYAGFVSELGSRGLTAGSDLDRDGKQELFCTHYDLGGAAGFEMGRKNLELIWYPDALGVGFTRMIQTGDLDGDGWGEIVFFRNGMLSDSIRGLYIYEANGQDNGFDLVYRNTLTVLSGDTISWLQIIEYFVIEDIDADGIQELVWAHNGINSVGPSRSEDFFSIISFPAGFEGGDDALVEEYWISPRDVDRDGIIENRLGGGSPVTLAITDVDGDGKREVFCHVWNWFNNFFIETVAPNSYTLGDTTYIMGTLAEDVDDFSIMQPAVADMNGDGHDEVYLGAYYTGKIFKIEDNDGDATHFTEDELVLLPSDPIYTLGAIAHDFTDDGVPEVYFGSQSTTGTDIIVWDGTQFDGFLTDPLAVGFVSKLAVADLNGNGKPELVTSHMELFLYRKHKYLLRVSEFGKRDTVPPPPTQLLTAIPDIGSVTLSWQRIHEADFLQYVIFGDLQPDPVTPLDTVVVFLDTLLIVGGLDPGQKYHFRMQVLDVGYLVSDYSNELATTVLSAQTAPAIPSTWQLHPNYPNPFNSSTTLGYEISQSGPVQLIVYNLRGQEMVRLVDHWLPAGGHTVVWNGIDHRGRQLASGIYIAVLRAPSQSITRKMVMLK